MMLLLARAASFFVLSFIYQTPPEVLPPPVPAPEPMPMPKMEESDAVKITNANDSIKRGEAALVKIQNSLDDPMGEYKKAESEFEQLNTKLKDMKANAAKLLADGKMAEAAKLNMTIKMIEVDWQLAKERFDIAIRQKKVSLEGIEGLKARIASDQALIARLEGKKPVELIPEPKPTEPIAKVEPPVSPKPTETPSTKPEEKKESNPVVAAMTGGLALPKADAEADGALKIKPFVPDENDPLIRQAREQIRHCQTDIQEVQSRVGIVQERVRVIERSMKTALDMLQLEKEAIAQAEKAGARIKQSLEAMPPPAEFERVQLVEKLADTEKRLAESRDRIQRTEQRIAGYRETLAGLNKELEVVTSEAANKQQKLAEAETELASLLSPTSTRNIVRWFTEKGPRVGFVLLMMIVLHLCVRLFSRHFVRFIIRNSSRGSNDDRENRAKTLVGVFRYAAAVVIFGGGTVMLLEQIGLPIVPLMGGAAVIGLAAAFGAQNLIRDYFTGFMMLMEDQYSVNDVVKIGSISGLVEMITLRVTVLRDLEGVRHFIPHGTITSVSNLTHGWSRAMFDIPVAYKENVDEVIKVLMKLGQEMQQDVLYGPHILDVPEMLGVDSFADSGVVIKFLLKTRPLKQWPIKREMLRRIKNRFDELGIDIPFPHRTVYHHFPDGTPGGFVAPSEYEQRA